MLGLGFIIFVALAFLISSFVEALRENRLLKETVAEMRIERRYADSELFNLRHEKRMLEIK